MFDLFKAAEVLELTDEDLSSFADEVVGSAIEPGSTKERWAIHILALICEVQESRTEKPGGKAR